MEQFVQKAIRSRRSVREFADRPVELGLLRKIIAAGIWAPSGLNNQPWRFAIVLDPCIRSQLAELTVYAQIVAAAPALVAVFLDQECMYDPVKDHQSAGACIQNMLLAAHELELGAVWIGQILKNKDLVNKILLLDGRHDLMALVAFGHPLHRNQTSQRMPLENFILHEFGGTAP